MRLAERVVQLKPSATLAVNALAKELASSGKDIISLSIGEPDFNTPQSICKAAEEAIESGFTRYTAEAGIPELRKAAAEYFNKNYGAGAGAEHVLIGNGGKQCLFNAFMALINPGDEVLMPTPCWVSYPAMIEIAGGIPLPVLAGVEKNFKVTVEDLERHLTPKTRLCIINTPSNPTGAVYSREELDKLAAWAVERNILIISDEIYDQLVYDGKRHESLCGWWNKHPENFAIVNGVAKSFAMTGWRVGYLLAHTDLIKGAGKLQGQSTSNVCSISQKAALAALTGEIPEMAEMKKAFERRCNLVTDIVSAWPKVTCPKPGGAFYIFPDMHKLYTPEMPDSTALCKVLLEKAGVALVPGIAFGDDNCVRLSYATDDDTLRTALDRIAKVLF